MSEFVVVTPGVWATPRDETYPCSLVCEVFKVAGSGKFEGHFKTPNRNAAEDARAYLQFNLSIVAASQFKLTAWINPDPNKPDVHKVYEYGPSDTVVTHTLHAVFWENWLHDTSFSPTGGKNTVRFEAAGGSATISDIVVHYRGLNSKG